jgi:hypothetical protein
VAWVEDSLIETTPAIKMPLSASDIVINNPPFLVCDMGKSFKI